jgi:hypothetical protein
MILPVLYSAGNRITWQVASRNCDRSLPVMLSNWVTNWRDFPFAVLAERELTDEEDAT